ncbi:MAG: cadherin-like beta sandwich domain-containing protein [Bacilli bacterium]
MKKTCFLILTIIFLSPLTVMALEDITINASEKVIKGASFNIGFDATGLTPLNFIKGFHIELEYPKTLVTFDSCKTTIPQYTETITNNTSKISYTGETTTNNYFSTNKTILNCKFTAIGEVTNNINFSLLATSFLKEKNDTSLPATLKTKNITIINALSSSNTLSSLTLDNIPFTFKEDILNYHLTVKQNINKTKITALATDNKAKVIGEGIINLKYGLNNFEIVVTAEDGSKKIYKLEITRENPLASDTSLKSLSVNNVTFKEKFNKDIKLYTATVPNNFTKVYVQATPTSKDSKVIVTGATNLTEGKENIIYVTVTSLDNSKEDYIIKILRDVKKQEEIKPVIPPKDDNKEETKPVTPPKEEIKIENNSSKKIILIIASVLCSFIIVLGAYYYLKKDKVSK